MTAVGKSARTPMKHCLLKKIIGREVGVITRSHWAKGVYQIVDLCAGDGVDEQSSPQLILKYALWLQEHGGRVQTTFIEKHHATYSRLAAMLESNSRVPTSVWRGCSNQISADQLWEGEPQLAFILNDPNTVNDFALTEEILGSAPRYTTTLSTLGCNPRGIKRMSREVRDGWFEHIYRVIDHMPSHHTAMIVSLNRDDAQWAYLITGPTVWFDENRYQHDCQKAFKDWEAGITMVIRDRSPGEFRSECDRLFLTKRELI